MDFQVAREPLLRALQLLQNIVEPRQTLPILANVLIEARREGLRLAATDLEVGARVAVPGTVAAAGRDHAGRAEAGGARARAAGAAGGVLAARQRRGSSSTCGGARFSLVGLPAEEYPPLDVDAGGGQPRAWRRGSSAR